MGELRTCVGGSRFLEVDPIEGGSANDYEYAFADPVNNQDLDGRDSKRSKQLRKVRAGLQRQIDIHKGKIAAELAKGRGADRGLIGHWEREIRGFQKQVDKINAGLKFLEGSKPGWGPLGAIGSAFAGGGLLWWAAKGLSPLCGPGAPACAIVL